MNPLVIALVVALLIVVWLLALIVKQFAVRHTHVQRVATDSSRSAPSAVDGEDFCSVFTAVTGTSLHAGNRIELLLNGDLFEPLFHALAYAQERILFQVFWLRDSEVLKRLGNVLSARARAGVEVRLILDDFGAHVDKAWIQRLREAGVHVARFRPMRLRRLAGLSRRSHVRAVLVDGRTGFTGGFGMDDGWCGEGRKHGEVRDTSVRIEGPALMQLEAAFIATWAEATGVLLKPTTPRAALAVEGGARAGVLYEAPSIGATRAELALDTLLARASKRIYLASGYFAPDKGMRAMLCATAARGVDIRILTPGEATDHKSVVWAARAHYPELLRAGVRLFEYGPAMLHSKAIVVDGWLSLVGSINLDVHSLSLNDECAVLSDDDTLARALEEAFFEDLKYAQEVSRPASERSAFLEQAKAGLSDVVVPFL